MIGLAVVGEVRALLAVANVIRPVGHCGPAFWAGDILAFEGIYDRADYSFVKECGDSVESGGWMQCAATLRAASEAWRCPRSVRPAFGMYRAYRLRFLVDRVEQEE